MTSRRYERLAAVTGVSMCIESGCTKEGVVHGSTIHAHKRKRFTQKGALWFLMTAYEAVELRPWYGIKPPWLARWRRVVWVQEKAKEARLRLPTSVWEMERARLREEVSRYKASTRQRPFALTQASRWAARRRSV